MSRVELISHVGTIVWFHMWAWHAYHDAPTLQCFSLATVAFIWFSVSLTFLVRRMP